MTAPWRCRLASENAARRRAARWYWEQVYILASVIVLALVVRNLVWR